MQKKKRGISLIVLVITIIIMIILAGTVVILLNNSGIKQKAKNVVKAYNEDEVNHMASLAWSEAYLNPAISTDEEYATAVTNSLTSQGIDISKYDITVTTRGVTVALKNSTSPAATISWTKTSEGNLAVGSEVEHIETEEDFYVIGFTGTNNDTVILLAKYNLGSDGKQDTTGGINPCVFCSSETWTAANLQDGENLNNNTVIRSDATSAVGKAIAYGESLGVTTGRLMLKSEADSANSSILYGQYEPGESLNYWLGTADYDDYYGYFTVWDARGELSDTFADFYYDEQLAGVRPVVEVPLDSIQ